AARALQGPHRSRFARRRRAVHGPGRVARVRGVERDQEVSDTIAALFAQVYAAPDDDAIRHVLADALIACGDPRGELIQLQLEPANAGALAKLRVESHYVPLFEQLLSRMMPIDSIGALVLVDVPADSESRLRSLARRHPNMQLELHVRPRIVTE